MGRHVLVAVDDSEPSRRAVEYTLGEYPDATITALHVFDPTHPGLYADSTGGSIERYETLEFANREHGEGLLEAVTDLATDYGREIRTELEPGTPTETILAYADGAADVDHLVVGSADRTAPRRVLKTSVPARLADRAPVPVTVVR